MNRVKELQAELRVLEAFNDSKRASVLRQIIEHEITKIEAESDVNSLRRPS